MNFDVIPKQLSELFNISTLAGESILVEKVYCYCPVFVNHNSDLAYLIELDMVAFDVSLCMDWLHAFYSSIDCSSKGVKF